MNGRHSLMVAGAGLALLIAFKFIYLLVEFEFDVTQAPVAFLVPLVVLIAGIALVAWGRASGIVVVAVVAVLLLLVFLAALVRHGLSQQNVADAVLVFMGIPLAIVALVAAITIWRQRAAITH
jgi:hypothetical protein